MMSIVANLSKATKSLSRYPKALPSFSIRSSSSSSSKSGDLTEDLLNESFATEGEWAYCSRKFMAPLQVPVRGSDILSNPLFNKGTAFKSGERDRLRFREFLIVSKNLNFERKYIHSLFAWSTNTMTLSTSIT